MTENRWQGFTQRVQAWREAQPWYGWAGLPPGPEREEKRLLWLEAYDAFQREAETASNTTLTHVQRERADALWRAQMARRGVPERVWPAVQLLRETPACGKVATWLGSPRWLLVLSGGVGTGKTTAASVAVLSEKGRMVTASETADHLFDRPWWEDLESYPLIAIDDVGTEKRDGEGYWIARWRQLLDARYRAKRRLIVTCNLPRAVFRQTYVEGDGGRTQDRVHDGGWFSAVEGESMRLTDEVMA